MKTNFLFSAALLLSMAATAQTSVKGKQTAQTASAAKSDKAGTNAQSSGNSSSAVALQAQELKNMEPGANKKGELLKDEIAAKKAAATQKAQADAKPAEPATTVESTTTASSAIALQAQELKNMEPGANKKGALLKDEIAAKKAEATQQAKGQVKKAENAVPQEVAVSANTGTASTINGAEKDNKTTGNASLSAGATVSGNGVDNNARELKSEAVQVVNKGTTVSAAVRQDVNNTADKAVVKTTKKVGAVGATTSATVKAVKPAPAAVRMNTRVKAATRIKIK